MYKLNKLLFVSLLIGAISVLFLFPKGTYAFTPLHNLIDNSQFLAKNNMREAQIQNFLVANGSYLANYVETRTSYIGPNNDVPAKGLRAANIIDYVAQTYGLNPQVILITLQKEQSLITTKTLNQYGIDWAMGYAVYDGVGPQNKCLADIGSPARSVNPNGSCKGFSMQVDWGASGGLIYSYNHINPNFPVGATVRICYTYLSTDCQMTYISNRATSSLYSYTPYYHGNWLFSYFYNLWFRPYEYSFVSAKNPPSVMASGQIAQAEIVLKNVGGATWYNEASTTSGTPFRLNVINGNKLGPSTGWVNVYRISMLTSSVAPGAKATFRFSVQMTTRPGTHLVSFVPIVENVGGLRDVGMCFKVKNTVSPLYRFYDPNKEIRYYTGNEDEKNYILSHWPNWKLEKVEGSVYTVNKVGTVPVYQFSNLRNGTSYYTANWYERQWLITTFPSVWRYIGISWYAYNHATTGAKPVYLLWSDRRQDNLLTSSLTEKNYLISHYPPSVWRYAGIPFYILK